MLYLFYHNILQSIKKIYNTIKEIWRKDCLIIAGKSRYKNGAQRKEPGKQLLYDISGNIRSQSLTSISGKALQ